MAGLGVTSSRRVQGPKQLINIKDKHLIDISLDCLDYEDVILFWFVMRQSIIIIWMNFCVEGDDIKVVILDKLTDGSVSSCLYAEEYIDNDAPLIIHTLDMSLTVFNPHVMTEWMLMD